MSSQFVKFFPSVMEETQNLIQSSIIMLIVSKAKGKRNCTMQKTWIAEKLYIDRKTVERNIKKLEEMGFITAETIYIPINGEPKTTTHFTLTEKLLKLIGAEESNEQPQPPTTSLQNDVATNASQQSERIKRIKERANKCVTTAQLYRLKMDVREGRI